MPDKNEFRVSKTSVDTSIDNLKRKGSLSTRFVNLSDECHARTCAARTENAGTGVGCVRCCS